MRLQRRRSSGVASRQSSAPNGCVEQQDLRLQHERASDQARWRMPPESWRGPRVAEACQPHQLDPGRVIAGSSTRRPAS